MTLPNRVDVLDHGYIRVVETWGVGDANVPEAAIVEAARQSTQGSFRGWESDRKLLAFLQGNKHLGPFEFAGVTVEVQAPILVFREWHRHRTQSYNEMSARYAPLPDVSYVPTVERLMLGAGKNKQAGATDGAAELTREQAELFRENLIADYAEFERRYQAALAAGVPKELARCGMPVGRYSRMRATANLRNWLAFITLRSDPAAQWEIRQYSVALEGLLAERFPETWALYSVGRTPPTTETWVPADALFPGNRVVIRGTKRVAQVTYLSEDEEAEQELVAVSYPNDPQPFLVARSALLVPPAAP